jgi:hypothetical protein
MPNRPGSNEDGGCTDLADRNGMQPDGVTALKAGDQGSGVATEALAPAVTTAAESERTEQEQWRPEEQNKDEQQ